MWKKVKELIRQKEIANRPNFMDKYEAAVILHIDSFLAKLDRKKLNEEEIKESVWRLALNLAEFRP